MERILDVIGDLMYGTMFTNYFAGRNRSPEDQAADILDIAFHGILSDSERSRRAAAQTAAAGAHGGCEQGATGE